LKQNAGTIDVSKQQKMRKEKKKLLLAELILGEEGSDYDWGDGLF